MAAHHEQPTQRTSINIQRQKRERKRRKLKTFATDIIWCDFKRKTEPWKQTDWNAGWFFHFFTHHQHTRSHTFTNRWLMSINCWTEGSSPSLDYNRIVWHGEKSTIRSNFYFLLHIRSFHSLRMSANMCELANRYFHFTIFHLNLIVIAEKKTETRVTRARVREKKEHKMCNFIILKITCALACDATRHLFSTLHVFYCDFLFASCFGCAAWNVPFFLS